MPYCSSLRLKAMSIIKYFILLIIGALLVQTSSTLAASYKNLESKGYSTSRLTKNRAGIRGWHVKKDGNKYFCKWKVSVAYIGNRIVQFSYSGRQTNIPLDTKTFEKLWKEQGGKLSDIPRYSDLKAGRLKSQQVGSCIKIKS